MNQYFSISLLEPEILRSLTSCFCALTRSVTDLLNGAIATFYKTSKLNVESIRERFELSFIRSNQRVYFEGFFCY